ncbi:hypothetical protein L2D08_10045 [Domibacillus sp. PGB-M46]|nr:hypothetical protein [Domibacillus sp. PGB-M46]MCI2254706.1 hypothetical protein [Domibacillus sp. PGB-M46]
MGINSNKSIRQAAFLQNKGSWQDKNTVAKFEERKKDHSINSGHRL